MKLMTFSEINDLENGQQIPALKGTVKKVFDQLTGEGNYGIWWLQSFIMTDEHATEIKCTWSGEDTVNNLEGKTILIESGRDKKDQLAGIKKEIKTKGTKRYETVKLDDRCKIQSENGKPGSSGEPSQDEVYDESDGPGWPEAPENAPQSPPTHPLNDSGVTEARKHLMQSANLLNLCVSAVNNAVAPHVPEIAQSPEFFQAQVATLFIEASRAGFVGKMPEKPIQ